MSSPTEETINPGGGLSVVPPPSELQILQQRITTLEADLTKLSLSESTLLSKNKGLTAELDRTAGKLRKLEENPFLLTLGELDAGAVLADAGEQLKGLSAEVTKRAEKGTFTLKLTVKPFKAEGAVLIIPEVRSSPPKPEPRSSVFYSHEDGSLSRNNPSQRELFNDRAGRSDAAEHREERKDNMLR